MTKNKLTKQEKEDIDIIIKHTRNLFEELFDTKVENAPLSYTCFGLEILNAVSRFLNGVFKKQQ